MGSSNISMVTTGDVEAQQHNPKWFVNHIHMLRPNQEGEANKLGYFILKVSEYMRQPPLAFSPKEWHFGLHNRANLDKNESDIVKLGIAVQYGLVGEKWVHFCDAIVDDPKTMLACYGLRNGVTSWTDEQIKHVLALDALFLATYTDIHPKNEGGLWTSKTVPFRFKANDVFFARFDNFLESVASDLCRVENQVPLVLIDKVVEYISNSISSTTSEGNELPIVDLQYRQRTIEFEVNALAYSFMDISGEAFKINNSSPLGGKTHILGITYNAICGFKGSLMKQSAKTNAYIHIPPATELEQSRIKFIGVDGPLCTMSFINQSLWLPKMRIFDHTIFIIRNMAWYECKSIPDGCLFSDYILLMIDLIQTPKDLDLLTKEKVIDNACGIKGFEMWTALKEGLIEPNSSQTHYDMKVSIKSRCDRRRYRLCSEFEIVFCSKPWLVLSTIVVVLVTMATLVQTYVAVIGSNEMKPKFP